MAAPGGLTYGGVVRARTPLERTGGPGRDPVYVITGARKSLGRDIADRQTRYLVSMGLRTVCFVAAVAAEGWLRWALLAGAVFLPYFSVVLANAGREPSAGMPFSAMDDGGRLALPAPGPAPTGRGDARR